MIRPALVKEYPEVMGGQDAKAKEEVEVFKRKWICQCLFSFTMASANMLPADYYCYCEVGFTTRTLGGMSIEAVISFEMKIDKLLSRSYHNIRPGGLRRLWMQCLSINKIMWCSSLRVIRREENLTRRIE